MCCALPLRNTDPESSCAPLGGGIPCVDHSPSDRSNDQMSRGQGLSRIHDPSEFHFETRRSEVGQFLH
jgi:hypothetical protein